MRTLHKADLRFKCHQSKLHPGFVRRYILSASLAERNPWRQASSLTCHTHDNSNRCCWETDLRSSLLTLMALRVFILFERVWPTRRNLSSTYLMGKLHGVTPYGERDVWSLEFHKLPSKVSRTSNSRTMSRWHMLTSSSDLHNSNFAQCRHSGISRVEPTGFAGSPTLVVG